MQVVHDFMSMNKKILCLFIAGIYLHSFVQVFCDESLMIRIREGLAGNLTKEELSGLYISQELLFRINDNDKPKILLLLSNNDNVYFTCFDDNVQLIYFEEVGFRYSVRMESEDITCDQIDEIIVYHGYHTGTSMFTEFVTIFKWQDITLKKIWKGLKSEKNGPYTIGDIVYHVSNSIRFTTYNDDCARVIIVRTLLHKVIRNQPYKCEEIEILDKGSEVFYWNEKQCKYTTGDIDNE